MKNTSAVTQHISKCEKYQKQLDEKYSTDATNDDKLEFISSCFSLLQSNLNNYNYRKIVESMQITLKKPSLNNQVKKKDIYFL